ncbi:hypothetical protein AB3R30_13020 [Leptolyngbyaceae cyanobacterium UHCC 1019]
MLNPLLILSAIPNPLHCQSDTGKLAIAGLFNASWFSSKLENRPMGNPDSVSTTLGDRIFRPILKLIQSASRLELYIDSGRNRRTPEST